MSRRCTKRARVEAPTCDSKSTIATRRRTSALGRALLNLEPAAMAGDRFKHVVEEFDEYAGVAFGGWGRAALKLEAYDSALERFEKAIERDAEKPVSIDHRTGAGDALYELKRFPEARRGLQGCGRGRRGSSKPLISQRYILARFQLGQGGPRSRNPSEEGALEHSLHGLDVLSPLWRESPAARGNAPLRGGGRPGDARELYQDAIASFRRASDLSDLYAPSADADKRHLRGRVLTAQGRYGDRLGPELREIGEAFERVEALDAAVDAEQHIAHGTALLWLDRLDEAEAAFEKALGPRRRNATAWAKLIEVYLEHREQSVDRASHWQWKAHERPTGRPVSLLEAQRDDTHFVEPLEGLGLLHLLMDDLDKAEPLLRESVTARFGIGARARRTRA